ncbi:hypothetical protein GF386_01060 [Candidatus Pacearchaeota archaeon]|nr:hypothetical protein [Candidatus Pacearchaeota archaeon]MBD3282821.1 hypothetical protein [Candidatus Pacearchaeota archaeon]
MDSEVYNNQLEIRHKELTLNGVLGIFPFSLGYVEENITSYQQDCETALVMPNSFRSRGLHFFFFEPPVDLTLDKTSSSNLGLILGASLNKQRLDVLIDRLIQYSGFQVIPPTEDFVELVNHGSQIRAAVYDQAEELSRERGGTVEQNWAIIEYADFLTHEEGLDPESAIKKATEKFGLAN